MSAGTAAILTFDIGTTACKTMVFDLAGGVLAQAECEYPMHHPQPQWAEQDADDWWRAAASTARQCVNICDQAGLGPMEWLGIGLSSQRETIVPIGADSKPLRPAITWMDRRTNAQAVRILQHFGRDEVHNRSGMLPEATFSATKLMWLAENQPATFEEAVCFLQPKEYVALQLTGEFSTDYSLASRTMMLDVRKGQWWAEMLDFAGVEREKLPRIYHADEVIGTLTRTAAEALGLPEGVPVVAGGGDRPCEALGAGIFGSRAMESTGTASNISCSADSLPGALDTRVLGAFHVLRGRYLIEQGMPTTGSVLRWFRDEFCASEVAAVAAGGSTTPSAYDLISEGVASSPLGAKGLLLLPFFMGSRSTRWNPEARGVFCGLTLGHTRGDLARAVMEGVSFEARACYEVLVQMGLPPSEVVVMGGGSKGSAWNQIKADISGKAIGVPRVTEAASLGAMILAGSGVGAFSDAAAASRQLNAVVRTFEPRPAAHAYYTEVFAVYNALYEATVPIYSMLEALPAPPGGADLAYPG